MQKMTAQLVQPKRGTVSIRSITLIIQEHGFSIWENHLIISSSDVQICYALLQNPSLTLKISLLMLRPALFLFKTVFVLSDLLLFAEVSCAPAQHFSLHLGCCTLAKCLLTDLCSCVWIVCWMNPDKPIKSDQQIEFNLIVFGGYFAYNHIISWTTRTRSVWKAIIPVTTQH